MHERPTTLSDPYGDWHGCEEILAAVLATDSANLTTADYHVIFAQNLPAADYDEGVYYLEHCFGMIARSSVIHESVYPISVLWWIDNFKEQLGTDGLLESTLDRVNCSMLAMLDRFELYSLTEPECIKLGRDFRYSVGAINSPTICDIVDDLTIWPLFDPVMDSILDWLSDTSIENRARWWVEIAFHSRAWILYYEKDCEVDNFERKQSIYDRLHRFETLTPAWEIARGAAFREGHKKYNLLTSMV